MAFWGPVLGVLFGVYLVLRVLPGFVVDTLETRRRKKQFPKNIKEIRQNTSLPDTHKVSEVAKNEWGGA